MLPRVKKINRIDDNDEKKNELNNDLGPLKQNIKVNLVDNSKEIINRSSSDEKEVLLRERNIPFAKKENDFVVSEINHFSAKIQ